MAFAGEDEDLANLPPAAPQATRVLEMDMDLDDDEIEVQEEGIVAMPEWNHARSRCSMMVQADDMSERDDLDDFEEAHQAAESPAASVAHTNVAESVVEPDAPDQSGHFPSPVVVQTNLVESAAKPEAAMSELSKTSAEVQGDRLPMPVVARKSALSGSRSPIGGAKKSVSMSRFSEELNESLLGGIRSPVPTKDCESNSGDFNSQFAANLQQKLVQAGHAADGGGDSASVVDMNAVFSKLGSIDSADSRKMSTTELEHLDPYAGIASSEAIDASEDEARRAGLNDPELDVLRHDFASQLVTCASDGATSAAPLGGGSGGAGITAPHATRTLDLATMAELDDDIDDVIPMEADCVATMEQQLDLDTFADGEDEVALANQGMRAPKPTVKLDDSLINSLAAMDEEDDEREQQLFGADKDNRAPSVTGGLTEGELETLMKRKIAAQAEEEADEAGAEGGGVRAPKSTTVLNSDLMNNLDDEEEDLMAGFDAPPPQQSQTIRPNAADSGPSDQEVDVLRGAIAAQFSAPPPAKPAAAPAAPAAAKPPPQPPQVAPQPAARAKGQTVSWRARLAGLTDAQLSEENHALAIEIKALRQAIVRRRQELLSAKQ